MVGVDSIPSSIIGTAFPVTFVHTCDSGVDWHWRGKGSHCQRR